MFRKRIELIIVFLLFLLIPAGLLNSEKIGYTSEQEYLFKIFQGRRSVRAFKTAAVPMAHIKKILDIARTAPTSGNQQPWKFLVIQDRIKLDALRDACLNKSLQRLKMSGLNDEQYKSREKRMNDYYQKALSAPVYIVILVDKHSRYPSYNKYDGPLAAGYLMIAARALGYGTVFYTDTIPDEITRKVLNIPDRYERICITPVGIPENWPSSPPKKSLDKFVVFEKFVKGVNYDEKQVRNVVKLDPKILKTYAGKYELQPGFMLTVTVEKDKLFAQATGQQKVEIFPESETKFFLKVVDARITFVKDKEGNVKQLILHQSGRDMPANRVD